MPRDNKVIDSTQRWFWTTTWQAGEREADTDRAAGRIETFDSDDLLIDALRLIAKPLKRRRSR